MCMCPFMNPGVTRRRRASMTRSARAPATSAALPTWRMRPSSTRMLPSRTMRRSRSNVRMYRAWSILRLPCAMPCPPVSVDQLAALVRPIRAGEVADVSRVGDQARPLAPRVDEVGGRLHRESGWGVIGNIQHDLVSGAGGGHDERAAPAYLDRTVQMAAQYTFDLRVPLDH